DGARGGRDGVPGDHPPPRGDRLPARSGGGGGVAMCGIAGIVRPLPGAPVEEAALRRMAGALRHRGPDGWGLVLDEGAGLITTRLALVGIEDGWQPLRGERSVIAYNGEVYNHVELGAGLDLRTHTDTEVVLRLL